VLAVGPAYSFDLERDVDELERLLDFARAGQLPDVDGARAAVLGGSYSALHVLRLLAHDHAAPAPGAFQGVVLLGPPADLFDMRRRYEDGSFIPPFGLDQALVALGLPDRAPLLYWRYSGVYHVRRDFPPVLLIHSRDDPVVPYQQSEQLAAALAAAGVPHELHFFETAGHYLLSEGAEAQQIYQLSVEFLDRQLTR
jgi:dipeptidyl aminopeptidase/acylaminoacyl peptidase